MKNENRILSELERNVKYLEEFKADLRKLLNEEITDYQDWNESITKKAAIISETAIRIDTLKMVLK